MAKSDQKIKVAPPSKQDLENGLQDYTSTIEQNIEDLYERAHSHIETDSVPDDRQGIPGEIRLVNLTTGQYLYVKFSNGWKRFVPA